MPLIKGSSREVISENIREMSKTHPQKQAVAAALSTARRYAKRATGGETSTTPWFVRNEARTLTHGPSLVVGISKPIGPLVTKGNLAAATPLGQALANSPKVGAVKPQFPKLPKPPQIPKQPKLTMKDGGRTEAPSQGLLHGPTPGRADRINTTVRDNSFIIPAHVVSALGEGNTMAGAAKLDKMFPNPKPTKAKGGKAEHVKVALSDGEYRLEPEHVLAVGKGDMARGHRLLKMACEHITNKAAEQLKRMPKPVDDGDE